MKTPSLGTQTKYILSVSLTITLTISGVYAWAGLTASTGDKLDAAKWNALVSTVQSGIPTGAVMSFNLGGCPSGWTPYAPAVGRTVIGMGAGAGSTTALADTGGEKSAPAISVVTHISVGTATVGGNSIALGNNGLTITSTSGIGGASIFLNSSTSPTSPVDLGGVTNTVSGTGTATDNMQPYVALLYCQKD